MPIGKRSPSLFRGVLGASLHHWPKWIRAIGVRDQEEILGESRRDYHRQSAGKHHSYCFSHDFLPLELDPRPEQARERTIYPRPNPRWFWSQSTKAPVFTLPGS